MAKRVALLELRADHKLTPQINESEGLAVKRDKRGTLRKIAGNQKPRWNEPLSSMVKKANSTAASN